MTQARAIWCWCAGPPVLFFKKYDKKQMGKKWKSSFSFSFPVSAMVPLGGAPILSGTAAGPWDFEIADGSRTTNKSTNPSATDRGPFARGFFCDLVEKKSMQPQRKGQGRARTEGPQKKKRHEPRGRASRCTGDPINTTTTTTTTKIRAERTEEEGERGESAHTASGRRTRTDDL